MAIRADKSAPLEFDGAGSPFVVRTSGGVMSRLTVIAAGQGESVSEIPVADGNGGYAWASALSASVSGGVNGDLVGITTTYANPPATSELDTFVRSPEDPLSQGGNWATSSNLQTTNPLEIAISGQCTSSSAALGGAIRTDVGTVTDCEAGFVVGTAPTGGDYITVLVRVGASGYYRAKFLTGLVSVYATNTLLSSPSLTITAGDVCFLRCIGTTVSLWHNGVEIWSGTDTSLSSGGVGVELSSQAVSITGFYGGTVTPTIALSGVANPTITSGDVSVGSGVSTVETVLGGSTPAILDGAALVAVAELPTINQTNNGLIKAVRETTAPLAAYGIFSSDVYDSQDPSSVGSDGVALFSWMAVADQPFTLTIQTSPTGNFPSDGVSEAVVVATENTASRYVARASGFIPSERYVQALETCEGTAQTVNLFQTVETILESA